ncbi:MAG: hypothetical protein ABI824_13480 [Acidobacteriota bacterium]
MDMELSKKTTILLSPALHERLTSLAEERRTSLGELVRSACEHQYMGATRAEKLAAVQRMASRRSPVGTPAQIKKESVPRLKSYDDIS